MATPHEFMTAQLADDAEALGCYARACAEIVERKASLCLGGYSDADVLAHCPNIISALLARIGRAAQQLDANPSDRAAAHALAELDWFRDLSEPLKRVALH